MSRSSVCRTDSPISRTASILAGLGFARVGLSFPFFLSLRFHRRAASAPSPALRPLLTTHYSLPTFFSHFSTHFHSLTKPSQSRQLPQSPRLPPLSFESAPPRSNDLLSKRQNY